MKTSPLILVLVLTACSSKNSCELPRSNLEMAEVSYETGCLNSALSSCSGTIERGACYDQAIRLCPVEAKVFRSWIANSGARK